MGYDIVLAKPSLRGNEIKYVTDCLASGWVSKGEYIKKFENDFGSYHHGYYATSVFNGTVALHLALVALGIQPGDEVIVPNLTYVASANAVRYCGAKVVLVDIDKDTWCIDPKEIEKKITHNTKAIMPVHIYGRPCDMISIMRIAKKHNLKVVEDCAEALGAEINGKKVGTFGDIGCFSFFGNKIITTGEGGMCITNNQHIDYEMKHLRNHAIMAQGLAGYNHNKIGFNYRMTNVQAAIGLAQFERLNEMLKDRVRIARTYKKFLHLDQTVSLSDKLYPTSNPVTWLFSCLINNIVGKGIPRYNIMMFLEKHGIETRPFFTPISDLAPYRTKEKFPNTKYVANRGINLPTYVGITPAEISKVCKLLSSGVTYEPLKIQY